MNTDDGIVSLHSDSITYNVQGEENLLISYWRKRSSTDVGNDVGVKVIITVMLQKMKSLNQIK
ncbi:MAG: hypothetical protein KGD64_11465 [Candidatus Heimdallarchaeota archaeon]|nr:hypothetical protein [Candidatus Heimdallarchaeota archaeon]